MLFQAYKQKCRGNIIKRKQLIGSIEVEKPETQQPNCFLRIRRLRSHFHLDSRFRLVERGARRTCFLGVNVKEKNNNKKKQTRFITLLKDKNYFKLFIKGSSSPDVTPESLRSSHTTQCLSQRLSFIQTKHWWMTLL